MKKRLQGKGGRFGDLVAFSDSGVLFLVSRAVWQLFDGKLEFADRFLRRCIVLRPCGMIPLTKSSA